MGRIAGMVVTGRMAAIVVNISPYRRNEMTRGFAISIARDVRFTITFLDGIVSDRFLLFLIEFSLWITYLYINGLSLRRSPTRTKLGRSAAQHAPQRHRPNHPTISQAPLSVPTTSVPFRLP